MAKVIPIGQPVNDAERLAIAHLRDHLPDAYTVLHNFELTVRAFLWRFERYVAKPCISLLRETQELQDSLLERMQRRQVAM